MAIKPLNNIKLKETEDQIKNKIPITAQIEFKLTSWDGSALKLEAPYATNRNHHDTFFGGSLAMAAIVSGYAMTFMALNEHLDKDWGEYFTLVIRDFNCRYLKPIGEDLVTVSKPEEISSLLDFPATLQKKNRARIKVITEVSHQKVCYLKATAVYVALERKLAQQTE
ncbi:MAG: hypothetical protein CMP10_19920 [Zetaproteobacteria bacterium]|nr:hypothetical protein [Pseudobdellovibrionaceae bacterium]